MHIPEQAQALLAKLRIEPDFTPYTAIDTAFSKQCLVVGQWPGQALAIYFDEPYCLVSTGNAEGRFQTQEMVERTLVDEFETWLNGQKNLQDISGCALEMLLSDEATEPQKMWLTNFTQRWERAGL